MTPKTLRIGKHLIGGGEPFIVAEAGINHNGDLRKALQMISLAKKCGANAVKFQTFKAEELCSDKRQLYTYRSQGKLISESMFKMFKRCEFTFDQWRRIKMECDNQEITFLSTPQNRSDLDLLMRLRIPAIKVGSDDFTNLPLLKDFSSARLPMILSCGMSTQIEIGKSLDVVSRFSSKPIILLLCTSEYPAPPCAMNLRRLETLKKEFSSVLLGLSDHSVGPTASIMAAALGGCVFEKHFTLDHKLPGPDHWFSEDPISLGVWVNSIRTAFKMLGNPKLRPTSNEIKMKVLARRSLVATKDIKKGDILNESNISLMRPGNGLSPIWLEKAMGRRATRTMMKGRLIRRGDFR